MKKTALLLIVFALTGCLNSDQDSGCTGVHYDETLAAQRAQTTSPITEPFPSLNPNPGFYASCQDLIDDRQALAENLRNMPRPFDHVLYQAVDANQCPVAEPLMMNGENLASPADDVAANQPTNTQNAIDEGDLVKISSKYIFYLKERSVQVLSRNNHSFVKSIALDERERGQSIYVHNDQLIVLTEKTIEIGHQGNPNNPGQPVIALAYGISNPVLRVYDLSDGIHLIHKKSLRGHIVTSRLSKEGKLTLVSKRNIFSGPYSYYLQQEMEKDLQGLDCSQIQKPFIKDHDMTMTNVYSLSLNDTRDGLNTNLTVLVGDYSEVYMKDHLFLTKKHINWFWYAPDSNQNSSTVVRLAQSEQGWKTDSVGQFSGRSIGQFSYHEKGDRLFVASTSVEQESSRDANLLTVLKKQGHELIQHHQSVAIAAGERMRSVRYTEDHAYLVTFRDVDPLFVFDISSHDVPVLMGELKVPGFSSYLHPIDNNTLLGVGRGASWSDVQVSLFDVSNPLKPKAIEQIQFKGSSTAQYDHHAFYFDPERKRIAIPYYRYRRSNPLPDLAAPTVISYYENNSGALFFDVSENSILLEASISHSDFSCSAYDMGQSIKRVHQIDEQLISFSDYGIEIHDQQNPVLILQNLIYPKENPEICN